MSEAELPDITETPVPVDNVEPTELAGAPVLSPQLPAQDGDGFKPLDPEPPAPVVAPAPRESSIQSRLEEMAMPNIVPNSDTEPFGAGIMMDNKSFNNANAPDIGFNPVPKDIVNEPMESSLDLQGAADIGSSILGNSSMSEMELQVQAQAIKFAREMQSRNQGEALEAGEGASEAMGALSATSKMLANSLGMKLPPPEYSGIPGIPEQLADTEPVASKKKKKKKKKKNGQKIDDIDESEVHAVIEAPPSSKPVISPEPMRESTPDIPQLDENRPAPDEGMQHEEGFPRFLPDREFPPPHERFHHGPPDRFPPDHFPPEGYPGPHEGPGPDHPMFHMHRGRGRGRGGMYDGPHRPPYDEYEGYEEEYGWRGRGRRGRGRPFPRHGKFRYRDDFDEEDFEEFGMPPDDFRHEHGPYHPGHGPPDMGCRPPRPPFGPEFSGPPRPGPPGHYGPPHEYGPRPPGPGHYGPRGPPNFPPHGPGYHEGYPGGYQGGPPFQPPPENFHGETFPPNFEGQHMPPQGHPGQPMPPHGHPGQPLPPHGHPGQPMPPHGPPLPGQPPPQQSFTGEVFPPEGFNAGAPFPHGMPPMPNMAPNDPNNPMPNQQTAENLIAQGMNPDLAKILNADVVIPPKVDAEPGKDKQKKKKKKGKGEALATEPSIQPMSIPLPEDVPLPPEPKKKKKKEKSKGLSDVLFPPLPESEPQFQGPAPRPMPENQPPLPMEVDQPAPPTDPEFLGPKPPEPDSDQFRGMIFNPQPVSGNIHVKEPKPPRRSRFDQVEPTPTIKSEPAPMPVPVPSPVPPPVMPVSTTQEFISQENISGIQEQLIKSEVGVEKIENPESNSDFDAFTEELLMQQKTFQEQQEALRQEQQVMQAESPINNVEKDMKESIPTDRANGTDETKKDDYVFFGNMIDSKEEKKENEAAQNKEPVTASQLLEKFKQRKLMKTDSDPDIKSRSREYGPPIVLSENKFSKKAENIDEQNVQKTVKEEPKAQGKFTIAIRKLKQIEAAQEEEEKHVMDSLVGNSESEVDKAKQSRKEKDDKSSKEKVDDSFESSKERKKRSKSRSKERTKKGRKYSGSRSASRERSRTPEKSRKYRDKMQSYSRSNSRERSTSRSRKSKSRERNERSRYRRSRSGSERRSRDREQKRSKDRHSRSKSREMVARKGKSMSPWRKDREFFKRYGRFPREGEADHIRYELPQTQRERGKHWDRDDQRDNRGRDFERRRRNERESRETESVDRKRDRRSSERSKDRDKKSNKEKESRRQSKRDSSDEESDESYVKEKRKERKKKKKEMHMEEQDENSDKERKREKKSKKDVSSDEAEEEHYKRDESLPKDKPSKDTKEEQIFEKRSTKERGPYTEEKRSEKSMDEEKEETSQRFDEHKGIERDEPYKESEVEAKQSEPGEIEESPKIPEMEGKNKIEEEMETEDGEITERDNEYPDVDQQTKDMLGVGQYIDDVGERSIDKEDDRMDTSKRESLERKHKEKKKKKRYSSSNSEYSESDLDQNDEIKYKKDRRVSSIERTKDEDYKKADPEKRSVVKRENKDEYPSVRDQKKMDRYRYGEDDEDGYENRGKKGKKHQSEDESDYDVRKSKKPKGKQREEFDEDEDAIENDKRKKERSYAQEESKFRDDDRRRDQRPSSKERGYTRDDIGNERGYGKDDFRRRENEKDTKRNDRRKEKYRLEDEMRKGSDRYQESEQGRQQKSSRYDKPEKDHERRKRYDSESEDDYRKRRQQRRNDSSEERSPRSKRQEKKRDAYDDMSSVPKNVVKSKWDSDNSDTGSEEETRKPERKERSESYKRESSGQPPVRPKDKFDIDISKINKAKLLDKMMNTKKKENDHSDEDSDDQDEEYPKQKRKKEARKIDKKEKKKKNLPSDSENEKPIKKSKKKKKEVTSDEDESPKKKDRKKKKKYNDESDQNSMDDEYSKKRIDREQTSKSKKAERKGKHRRDDSENNDDEAEYNKKKRKDKAKSRHMSPDEEETSEKEDKQRRKKRNESDDEMKERGRKREKSTDKKKSKVKKKNISESDGESDDRNSKEKYRRKKEKANDQDSDRDSFRKEKQWKKEKFSDQDSDRESLRKERKSKKERDPSDSPKRKRDKQDKKKKRQRSDDSESRSPSRSRTVSQKKKQKYTPSESEDESRGKKDRRRKYESSENDEERYPKKTKKKAKESKKYEKDLNDDSDEEMLQESRNKQKDKSERKSRKEMTDEEDEVRRSSERSKRERNGKHKRSVDRYSDDDKYNDRASNQDDRKRGKKRDDILDEKGRRIDEGGGGGTRKFWKGDDEKHTQKQSKKSRKYSTSDSETSSHNSSDSDSSRSDSDHQKKYKTSKTGSKNVQAGASPTRGLVPDYPIESEEEKAKESNQKQKQKKGKHKKKKKHKHKKLSKKGKDKHEKDGDEDYLIKDKEEAVKTVSDNTDEILETQNTNEQLVEVSEPLKTSDRIMEAQDGDDSLKTTNEKNPAIPMQSDNVENTKKSNDKKDDQIKKGRLEENLETMKAEENKVFQRGESEESDTTQDSTSPGKPDVVVASFPDKRNHEKNDNSLKNDDETNDQQCHPVKESEGNNVKHDNQSVKNESFHEKDISPEKNIILYDPFESLVTDTVEKKESGNEDGNQLYDPFETMLSHEEKDEYTKTNEEHYSKADLLEQNIKSLDKEIQNAKNLPAKDVSAPSVVPIAVNPNQTSILPISNLQQNIFPVPLPVQAPSTYVPSTVFPSIDQPKGIIQEPLPTENITKLEKTVPEIFSQNSDTVSKNDSSVGFMHETMTEMGKKVAIKTIIPKRIASETPTVKGKSRWDANGSSVSNESSCKEKKIDEDDLYDPFAEETYETPPESPVETEPPDSTVMDRDNEIISEETALKEVEKSNLPSKVTLKFTTGRKVIGKSAIENDDFEDSNSSLQPKRKSRFSDLDPFISPNIAPGKSTKTIIESEKTIKESTTGAQSLAKTENLAESKNVKENKISEPAKEMTKLVENDEEQAVNSKNPGLAEVQRNEMLNEEKLKSGNEIKKERNEFEETTKDCKDLNTDTKDIKGKSDHEVRERSASEDHTKRKSSEKHKTPDKHSKKERRRSREKSSSERSSRRRRDSARSNSSEHRYRRERRSSRERSRSPKRKSKREKSPYSSSRSSRSHKYSSRTSPDSRSRRSRSRDRRSRRYRYSSDSNSDRSPSPVRKDKKKSKRDKSRKREEDSDQGDKADGKDPKEPSKPVSGAKVELGEKDGFNVIKMTRSEQPIAGLIHDQEITENVNEKQTDQTNKEEEVDNKVEDLGYIDDDAVEKESIADVNSEGGYVTVDEEISFKSSQIYSNERSLDESSLYLSAHNLSEETKVEATDKRSPLKTTTQGLDFLKENAKITSLISTDNEKMPNETAVTDILVKEESDKHQGAKDASKDRQSTEYVDMFSELDSQSPLKSEESCKELQMPSKSVKSEQEKPGLPVRRLTRRAAAAQNVILPPVMSKTMPTRGRKASRVSSETETELVSSQESQEAGSDTTKDLKQSETNQNTVLLQNVPSVPSKEKIEDVTLNNYDSANNDNVINDSLDGFEVVDSIGSVTEGDLQEGIVTNPKRGESEAVTNAEPEGEEGAEIDGQARIDAAAEPLTTSIGSEVETSLTTNTHENDDKLISSENKVDCLSQTTEKEDESSSLNAISNIPQFVPSVILRQKVQQTLDTNANLSVVSMQENEVSAPERKKITIKLSETLTPVSIGSADLPAHNPYTNLVPVKMFEAGPDIEDVGEQVTIPIQSASLTVESSQILSTAATSTQEEDNFFKHKITNEEIGHAIQVIGQENLKRIEKVLHPDHQAGLPEGQQIEVVGRKTEATGMNIPVLSSVGVVEETTGLEEGEIKSVENEEEKEIIENMLRQETVSEASSYVRDRVVTSSVGNADSDTETSDTQDTDRDYSRRGSERRERDRDRYSSRDRHNSGSRHSYRGDSSRSRGDDYQSKSKYEDSYRSRLDEYKYQREKERERERYGSRERSRERDRHRGRSRDRVRSKDRDRSRERDRSRDRKHRRRHDYDDKGRYDHHSSRRDRRRSYSRERRSRSRGRRSRSRERSRSRDRRSRSLSIGKSRDKRSRSRDRRSRSLDRQRRSRSRDRKSGRDRRNRSSSRGRRSASRDRRSRSRDRHRSRRSRSRSKNRSHSRERSRSYEKEKPAKVSALDKLEKEIAEKKKALVQSVDSPVPSTPKSVGSTSQEDPGTPVVAEAPMQAPAPHFLPQPFPVHEQQPKFDFQGGPPAPEHMYPGMMDPNMAMYQSQMMQAGYQEGMPPMPPFPQGPPGMIGPDGMFYPTGPYPPGPMPGMDPNYVPPWAFQGPPDGIPPPPPPPPGQPMQHFGPPGPPPGHPMFQGMQHGPGPIEGPPQFGQPPGPVFECPVYEEGQFQGQPIPQMSGDMGSQGKPDNMINQNFMKEKKQRQRKSRFEQILPDERKEGFDQETGQDMKPPDFSKSSQSINEKSNKVPDNLSVKPNIGSQSQRTSFGIATPTPSPSEDVKEPVWSASEEEKKEIIETPEPKAPETPCYPNIPWQEVPESEKPIKVKSRWRQSSEAQDSPSLDDDDEPPDSEDQSEVDKENLKQEVPIEGEETTEKEHKDKHEGKRKKEKKADKTEDDESEEIPINFDLIDENIYLMERRRSKQMREVKRMVCDCTTSREDREMGYEACGEDCLNRMLFIECGSKCPCGDHCTNKRFQKKQNSQVAPFRTDWKGYGLKALEDLEPGQFVMEYVGEVLDYRQFKSRSKQYSKQGQEHFYFMAVSPEEVVDATLKGNVSRFINHSCDPNCETQKWTVNGSLRVGFFVRKPIKKDEEITFDYKYEVYGKEAQKCYCGTDLCRGWLGGDKRMELKSSKRTVDELEKKKKEMFDDSDKLEEEIERMSELQQGLRNKNDVLNICRLMVRAEDPEHRALMLKVIENTSETACLRLFLDYHGLSLLWCWMADLKNTVSDMKLLMLKILKKLPITNKTILTESKVLDIVTKWSEMSCDVNDTPEIAEAVSETTDNNTEDDSEVLLSPPVTSNKNPISILSSLRDSKVSKKRVKFADEASSSDSESRTSESDYPAESVEGDVSSTSQVRKSKRKLTELRRKVLNKDGSEPSSENVDMSESRDSETIDAETSQSNEIESSQKESEVSDEVVETNEALTTDKNEAAAITEEDKAELEHVVKAAEIKAMAKDLLSHWANLKEVYKIPKKEVLKERKRTEKELDTRYDKIAKEEKMKKKVSGWDIKPGRKRKRESSYKEDTDDSDSGTSRKANPNLTSPPKLSKSERRQLFEAQVKAQDEMNAEYQRQQEQFEYEQQVQQQLHMKQLMEDPNFMFYAIQDPSFLPTLGIDPQQFIQSLASDPVLLQSFMAKNPNFPQQLEALTLMYQQVVMQASQTEMVPGYIQQEQQVVDSDNEPMTEQHLAFLQQVEAFKQQHLEPQVVEAEEEDIPPPPSPPKNKTIVLPPNWKTAKDAEGKLYYYHTATRQTQWDPPNLDTGEHTDDMDLGTPTLEDPIPKPDKKETTTTAAADTSSETSKKLKEQFKSKMSSWIVVCLNPFRKPDCKLGKINSTEDFKHLARKLTHHVMAKELKHCRHVEDLEVNENVKSKAKDFVKKYMTKFGDLYKRSGSSPNYD